MNITFLIGNGFDVGVGMKSRFRDFFPTYIAQSHNKSPDIKQLATKINENYDTWADFEMALGKYTELFLPASWPTFISQMRDFENDFIEYLKEEENSLALDNQEYISNKMLNALQDFYSQSNLAYESFSEISKVLSFYRAENYVYNFINYNYTTVLEKCLDKIPQKIVLQRKTDNKVINDKIGKIIHVHGLYNTHPIMGVNDSSQIVNENIAKSKRHSKYIIKPEINKNLRQGFDNEATTLIKNSVIICVYGMSLGATDKKWWDLILQTMASNGRAQLIIYLYDEEYSPATSYDYMQREDAIIDRLSSYNSNKMTNIEDLRSRIHIAIHKNIFSINLKRNANHIILDNTPLFI